MLVNFISVFFLVGGGIVFLSIKKEARPVVNLGSVYFTTVYPGASPLDVEKLITIPIEDELAKVEGISKLMSASYTGVSRVWVEIDPDIKDQDKVAADLFRAIDQVKKFPEGVDKPQIFEVKSNSFPVFFPVLYSEQGIEKLYQASDIVETHLKNLDGVAGVEPQGKKDPVFDIEADPESLIRYNVSLNDMISVITSYNKSGPAGSIVSRYEDTQIRFDNELDSTDKISDLVVRVNEFGKGIKIKDLARVVAGFEDDRTVFRYDNRVALGLSVRKMESADTIKTVNRVRKELERIKDLLPEGVSYDIIWDDSYYVKDTLTFTVQNAGVGLVLVILMLFVGLNCFRMSFVTSIGIPIALFGSIIVVYLMGFSLNMMTLIGIILVLGMLVDDGIVVSENIFYNVENGMPLEEAGVRGTMQVMLPVIGAVSTTIVAFIPLIFMKGIMGKFMSIIPVAVISALAFSLFECFFILPNHAVHILKGADRGKIAQPNLLMRFIDFSYSGIIVWVVKKRYFITFLTVVFLVGVSWLSYKKLKFELFSLKGAVSFGIIIKGPDNISLEQTTRVAAKVDEAVKSFIPRDIKSFSTQIGSSSRQHGAFVDLGTNYAMITAYFPDLDKRERDETDVINDIRSTVSKLDMEGYEVSFDIQKGGPPTGKPIDLQIKGDNIEQIIEVTDILKQEMTKIKGLSDISDTLSRGKYEYTMKLNQKLAKELGISAYDIQLVAMSAFEGTRISSIRQGMNDCYIRVTFPRELRNDINNLLKIKMPTKPGTYATLGSLVTLEKNSAQSVINRASQIRFIGLTAENDLDVISVTEANSRLGKIVDKLDDKYKGVMVEFGGEEKERIEVIRDIAKLAIIAFMAIYMIISLIFGNMKEPFFIISAIPFGLAGAVLALIAHGMPVSVSALISLVGLSGVVVNDSILLIRTIREYYSVKKLPFDQAIIEGSRRRLRPIFLTSVTTLAGLFPAAYELFGVNVFMQTMSLVMGWGLLFSTLLTMLSLPALLSTAYRIFYGVKARPKAD
ncbi:MAG: efflux RND transporter permease subunit [Oligoflexia bacterium]|nr:efflux RND transporter permease subunit [Oligoflexia bacterium]